MLVHPAKIIILIYTEIRFIWFCRQDATLGFIRFQLDDSRLTGFWFNRIFGSSGQRFWFLFNRPYTPVP